MDQIRSLPPRPVVLCVLDGWGHGPNSADNAIAALKQLGYARTSLRDIAERLGPTLFGIGGRAVQIVTWGQNHRHCGRCGAQNQHADDERAQVCPECGLMCFPRLSPAISAAAP